MPKFEMDADPAERAKTFLCEYVDAPNDADIEFRQAVTEDGEAAMVISINGSMHGFTASEARVVADIAEHTMRHYAGRPEAAGFPSLIVALRGCADKVSAPLLKRH